MGGRQTIDVNRKEIMCSDERLKLCRDMGQDWRETEREVGKLVVRWQASK